MTRVKICGVTRGQDALLAARLGAAAIGFVFWPGSPRFIEPPRAREIVRSLPPFVTAVGVFVDQPANLVEEVASMVGLGAVQLNGDEDLEYVRAIGRPVIKAASLDQAMALNDRWPPGVTLLLDAVGPGRRGGTGQTVDWTRAAVVAASRRIILAGGLRPENVANAICRVRPSAIDASSGVETGTPGLKDGHRLRSFFAAVAAVEGAVTWAE